MDRIKRILLVDDDEVSNFVSKISIDKSNLVDEVIVKMNGREAAQYFEECEDIYPELVLLDINMPLMNGFELLDLYINSRYSGKTKFAMLSTSTHQKDRTKAKEYKDVIAYVEKPLSPDIIKNLVGKLR